MANDSCPGCGTHLDSRILDRYGLCAACTRLANVGTLSPSAPLMSVFDIAFGVGPATVVTFERSPSGGVSWRVRTNDTVTTCALPATARTLRDAHDHLQALAANPRTATDDRRAALLAARPLAPIIERGAIISDILNGAYDDAVQERMHRLAAPIPA